MLKDRFGRAISYLRVSITDRCNLRCRYCRPQQEFQWLPQASILSLEEIYILCSSFVELGVAKIRITGGEPLVRRGVVELAGKIASLPGLQELCLTTNGLLLKEMARGLLSAGITHLNVSLDTLNPSLFEEITGKDALPQVLDGIETALDLGFDPVKINTVVMRGINHREVGRLAALAKDRRIHVRFIEFMPVGRDCSWSRDRLVKIPEIRAAVEQEVGPLEPVTPPRLSGPASLFRFQGSKGYVGFISPMSQHFCTACNRVRITADGRLRLCLFSDQEVDLKGPLREQGLSGPSLTRFLASAIHLKPKGLDDREDEPGCQRIMSTIGG